MGLPIWRDPDEKPSNRVKIDPTAHLRSSIRRRNSVHGRRARTRLPRDPSLLPPRFERSPPPSQGFNGLRDPRRGENRGVPSISNLLEAANGDTIHPPPPPPPAPESQSYRHHGDPRPPIFRERLNAEPDAEPLFYTPRLSEARRLVNEAENGIAQVEARLAEMSRRRDESRRDVDVVARTMSAHGMRRSASSSRERDASPDRSRLVAVGPRPTMRIMRSPEPMSSASRPHSRNGSAVRRSALPTPPLDASGPEEHPYPERSQPRGVQAHPLSHAWHPESPINGLGDRNRSPTPGDGWEIMRSTITPDETLPSAESSFASAAASQSFNASSNSTQITEPEVASSASSRRHSGVDESDTASSADPDELVCTDEDIFSSEGFAEEIYFEEMRNPEGRERIADHLRIRDREGNRFALASEAPRVDIGFRLIEEALETEQGRERLMQIRRGTAQHLEDILRSTRRRLDRNRRRLLAHDAPPSPHPELYSEETHRAVRESQRQVTDYFRRFEADALEPRTRTTSPPPQYEPTMRPTIFQQVAAQTSRDGPEPHPVSPPSNRSEPEISDALLSGDVQDLDSMRRIVERLAARDDVPEEWWMSMGLNLSRSRPRPREHRRERGGDGPTVERVVNGRIERRDNPRL